MTKHKLPAKTLCCSWTPDGQHLALGLANGMVTIRSTDGEERVRARSSRYRIAVRCCMHTCLLPAIASDTAAGDLVIAGTL